MAADLQFLNARPSESHQCRGAAWPDIHNGPIEDRLVASRRAQKRTISSRPGSGHLPGKGELRSECDKDCAGKPDRHVHHVGVYEFQPQGGDHYDLFSA